MGVCGFQNKPIRSKYLMTINCTFLIYSNGCLIGFSSEWGGFSSTNKSLLRLYYWCKHWTNDLNHQTYNMLRKLKGFIWKSYNECMWLFVVSFICKKINAISFSSCIKIILDKNNLNLYRNIVAIHDIHSVIALNNFVLFVSFFSSSSSYSCVLIYCHSWINSVYCNCILYI